MSTILLLQARISGGTRMPGVKKVLADIGGRTLIERQMERMQRCKLADRIVVAIPDTEPNDELAEFCKAKGWTCFRGQEDNVLKRYALAAKKYKAKTVVRVTADCPLIDWSIIDRTVMLFQKGGQVVSGGFDYVSNNLERTFPHGLDVEVFSAKVLREADKLATDAFDREHVTEYIRSHQDRPYKLGNLRSPIDQATPAQAAILIAARLTVDYPEDLEFVRGIYSAFPDDHYITVADIVGLLEREPERMKVNEHRALEHAQKLLGRFEPISEEAIAVDKYRRELAMKQERKLLQ